MKYMMLLLSYIAMSAPVFSDEKLDAEITQIQHDWAKANYQTSIDSQENAFKILTEQAHQLTISSSNAPAAKVWSTASNFNDLGA